MRDDQALTYAIVPARLPLLVVAAPLAIGAILMVYAGLEVGNSAAAIAGTAGSLSLLFATVVVVARVTSGGQVSLTGDGLTISNRLRREFYPWQDIKDIAPTQRTLIGLPPARGGEPGRRVIEISLLRSQRLEVVPGTGGTRVFGLPTFVREVFLRLDDPDGFLSASRPYLARS